MRLLLNPVIVRELDQIILRPGRSLMHAFYGPVVITPAGEKEAGQKPGVLPEEQPLLAATEYGLFWGNEKIQSAAGGGLNRWVDRVNSCQWEQQEAHDNYHHTELVTTQVGNSYVRLCWHHDRVLIEQSPDITEMVARRNAAEYVLYAVRRYFRYPEHHQISLVDLGCWAMIHRVAGLLPESALRHLLRLPDAEPIKSVYRESELDVNPPDPPAIIAELIEDSPVLSFDIVPDAPAQYMRRPKIPRWKCDAYTAWVKRQPCCGCGSPSDDPHHLIGHGFGGTGTKAGDFHVIPVCRICHRELHDNVSVWECKHGTQLEHILSLQHRALGLGVIVMERA